MHHNDKGEVCEHRSLFLQLYYRAEKNDGSRTWLKAGTKHYCPACGMIKDSRYNWDPDGIPLGITHSSGIDTDHNGIPILVPEVSKE